MNNIEKATVLKFGIVVFILCFVAFCLWKIQHLQSQIDNKVTNVHVMTEKQATDINYLQNETGMNRQNAESTSRAIMDARMTKKTPVVTYNETYVDDNDLIPKIREKIVTGDYTMPPEALEKTDATIVAPQSENKEATVGIYKINNYKNWELGVGVGVHDGDIYVPVSVQRNLSRWHSVAAEVHVKPMTTKVNGGEVRYTVNF